MGVLNIKILILLWIAELLFAYTNTKKYNLADDWKEHKPVLYIATGCSKLSSSLQDKLSIYTDMKRHRFSHYIHNCF